MKYPQLANPWREPADCGCQGWRREEVEQLLKGYRVSFQGGENVLQPGNIDGCTTL
jgi:hypothetical protein